MIHRATSKVGAASWAPRSQRTSVVALLAASLFLRGGASFADPASLPRGKAEVLTHQLVALGALHRRAERAAKPAILDKLIAAAAERHTPGQWVHMLSAAGHDPMVLSAHLPCAMLFVPSISGISHDFAEDTHEADIILGCQVLADAAAAILSRH